MKLVAKTFFGLEEILASEIKQIGGKEIQLRKRAVEFEGDMELVYKANLYLRTALRILMPIKEFTVRGEKELYGNIRRIDWSEYFGLKDTFAVDSVVNSKHFTHTKYPAFKTKDAIVDQFRTLSGKRPNVNTENPTILINLHIFDEKGTVSLDTTGESLHRRGYRTDKNAAPLNEVLAAAMVLKSNWKPDQTFIDPMCGSGTIPIEAAMIGQNIPPNLLRSNFSFMNWRNFDKELWEKVKENAQKKIVNRPLKIYASDKSTLTLRIAERNIERAGLRDVVKPIKMKFENLIPPKDNGVIIMNPPYGERMKPDDIFAFYKMIGDKLKESCEGYDAWVISSNMEAFKFLGLRTSEKVILYNGALECRFNKYEMYQGSKS